MLFIILLNAFIAITLLILLFFPRSIFAGETSEEEAGTGIIYQLRPLLATMAKINARIELKGYKQKLQEKMMAGGNPLDLTPDEFIAFSELSAIAGVIILAIVFGISSIVVVIGSLFGFFMTTLWLSDTVKKRKASILRQLPDFLDILTLAVEAGLDFGAALKKVISVNKNSPLIEEFKYTMNEFKLGKTRHEGLKNLAKRVNIPDLTAFISSLLQADKLGASLGDTLRIQANQMRVKRMQRAEKAGGEASVKMLIPLMLFILPAVFIMLFGPIIIQVMTKGF